MGFEQYQFEMELAYQFEEHNIDIWNNNTRMIMLKQYRTQNSLLDWEIEDQVCIAAALHTLPKKYFNNLYFFMILDFNTEDTKIKLKINEIEKNNLICKKYVFQNTEDLDRVPFLMNSFLEINRFSFDQKFKERLMSFNQVNTLNLDLIMEDYFKNFMLNKSASKIKIETLIDKGD